MHNVVIMNASKYEFITENVSLLHPLRVTSSDISETVLILLGEGASS